MAGTLSLTRRVGEKICIGSDILIEVVEIGHGKVKLAFTAPQYVSIDREEVRIRKDAERPERKRLDPPHNPAGPHQGE